MNPRVHHQNFIFLVGKFSISMKTWTNGIRKVIWVFLTILKKQSSKSFTMDITPILTSEFIYKYFLSSKQLKKYLDIKNYSIYIYIYEWHVNEKTDIKKFEIKANLKKNLKTGYKNSKFSEFYWKFPCYFQMPHKAI